MRCDAREHVSWRSPSQMERIKYEKPSKVNFVSVMLLLGALAALYAAIQYGPPYYRRWRAANVLSEITNKIYPKRFMSGPLETEVYDQLRKETVERLQQLGIANAAGSKIEFSKNQREITGSLDYSEQVKHWFVNKTSVLSFHLVETIPINN
jgi:hypothetical protein